MQHWPAIAGGLLLAAGVVAGAFGAHGLRGRLEPQLLEAFETAVRYQLIHAALLVVVGLTAGRPTALDYAAGAWLAGILLFSGSLYLMTLAGIRGIGMVTPIGGLAFIVGHLLLAWGAWRWTPGG